jgi:hypothetical protein
LSPSTFDSALPSSSSQDVRAGSIRLDAERVAWLDHDRAAPERDRDPDDRVALPELDDVSRLERELAAVALVEADALLAADDGRAVGRLEVAEEVALFARDDSRVLPRDVFVGEYEVVPGRAPDPDHPGRKVVTRPPGPTLSDLQADHRPPIIHRLGAMKPSAS